MLAALAGANRSTGVREMVVTWEEALAESRAEGEAIAKQEDILAVARHRFAELPSGFDGTVRAISDLDHLNDLFEQLLKANAIDDLDLE